MLQDITKCEGSDCPLKEKCWRFISASAENQLYFVGTPFKDNKCDYFVIDPGDYTIKKNTT